MTSQIINVISANVGRKKSPDFRKRQIRKMRRRCLLRPPLFMLQEIDEGDTGDEAQMLRDVMPRYDWTFPIYRTPVGVPADWRTIERRPWFAHGGIAGESPSRWVVSALVQHKKFPWMRLVLISSHVIRQRVAPEHQALRDEHWQQWLDVLQRVAYYWADKRGETALIGMDANEPDLPRIHPREQRLVHAGIDYILAVEPADPKVTVTKRAEFTIPLGIDSHKAHGLRLEVTDARS